jgi:hypothetical protein
VLRILPRSESETGKVRTLEIVWRNPAPISARRRRQSVPRAGDRALYLLQEFVHEGDLGHWTTISDLEVVAGGRVA